MKSWFLKNSIQGRHFQLRDVPSPEPKSDEILIQVQAAALNRGEFLNKTVSADETDYQACGIECAGVVIKVGENVKQLRLGDRVMGRSRAAFSEKAILLAGNALLLPSGLSWETAACASITYQTAFDMLWPGGSLQKNEWLLIAGISSGVGLAALQLGKLIGARVIGTSRSLQKLQLLKKHDLDYGLILPGESLAAQVLEITNGKGVDLIINNIGASIFAECVRMLAYKGRLATVGSVDGEKNAQFDSSLQHTKRLKFFGVSSKMRGKNETFELVNKFKMDVLPAIANGKIKPIIDEIYKFDELPKAVDRMVSNLHFGKIIIKI
ncbi:NADPH:quinone reductase [Desulfuromusa kysingii]|uniref:NADPH:quinone reductase n=1 Tax=Desulfuromusa kysingii TaxID=37625 RepID=A0A1H3ZQC9_9BACT|nr:zinc-binding alcohol dehydrogenase family protein [Desulfuromusa kysingii]SEA25983.1 NADPH:quinone reductase [Desulfuromusa kysingii]